MKGSARLNLEKFDLSNVHERDRSTAELILYTLASMEEQMPELQLTMRRHGSKYHFVISGMSEMLSTRKISDLFYVDGVRDSRLDCVEDILINPDTKNIVIRWDGVPMPAPAPARHHHHQPPGRRFPAITRVAGKQQPQVQKNNRAVLRAINGIRRFKR